MTKRRPQPPDRRATVGFRVSSETKERLRDRAHSEGQRLGEWLRTLVEQTLKEDGKPDG